MKPSTPGLSRVGSSSSLAFAALAVSHLPMLIAYFAGLARHDHYHFFPFALGAIGWYGVTRIRWSDFSWNRVGIVLIGFDILLLFGSAVLGSPWLAAVGAFFLVTAVCFSATEFGRRPFELALLFLTVVRPPSGADIQLIQKLQPITSQLAGGALDRMGVLHVVAGNLIELPNKMLFVEEACSGVQSLFTLLFLAAFVVARYRRPPLHAVVLLACAPVCAITMNVVRVVVIAVAWDTWQLDITEGLGHDLLGYVLLAIATLFLFSADQLVCFLGCPISERWAVARERTFQNPFVNFWNLLWSDVRGRDKPTRFLRKPTLIAISTGCVLLAGSQCYSLFASPTTREVSAKAFVVSPPERIGSYSLHDTSSQTRTRSNSFGQHSQIWRYRDGGLQCTFSLDFPFSGWHALDECYIGQGWTVTEHTVSEGQWPMVGLRMSKPTGEHAYVAFSLFEADGKAFRPPALGDPTAALFSRLLKDRSWLSLERTTYQSQLLVVSPMALTESQIEKLNEHHLEMREVMRDALKSDEGRTE